MIFPLSFVRFAPAAASSVGYRFCFAMRRFARASSMRETAIFRSRLFASASSTRRVSCSSWNIVQNCSTPCGGGSVIAGSSEGGFDVSMCTHAPTSSAAPSAVSRANPKELFIAAPVPRRAGPDPCRFRQMLLDGALLAFLHLGAQFLRGAHFAQPALRDDAEEQRHEEDRE